MLPPEYEEAARQDDGLLPLWVDNLTAVELFGRMCTQWNYGAMGGVLGLRYESLPMFMRILGIARAEQAEAMDCLQVMEVHAITLMNTKR